MQEGSRRCKKVLPRSNLLRIRSRVSTPFDIPSRLCCLQLVVLFANSDLLSLHQCFPTAPEREHQQMKDAMYVIRSTWRSLKTAHRLKYTRKRDPWLPPRYVGVFICVSIAVTKALTKLTRQTSGLASGNCTDRGGVCGRAGSSDVWRGGICRQAAMAWWALRNASGGVECDNELPVLSS